MAERLRAADATADAERAARRLTLSVARRVDGLLHGDHLGILPGHGSEPADSREYVPGLDDVRRIDWAVTARTTVPHVRDLVADRELETTIVVDLSPSMSFGTAGFDKRELAAGAVATIAMMTLGTGNRVGAVLLTPTAVQRIPAKGGRAAVLGIVRRILDQRPPVSGLAATVDLATGLTAARAQARRRGFVVVVSDFLEPLDGSWLRLVRGLVLRHQVLAVEVGDPREDQLPDVGTVVLRDPETGRAREITLTREVRETYQRAAAARHVELVRALRSAGAAHVALRTDRDWVRDIAGFAVSHRRTSHVAARPAGAAAAVGGPR